jgi:phosphatidylserine/phosphatidylglycerophosphate/cardiolipin synthase-like enzyme
MVEGAKRNVTVLGYRVHSGAKPIFDVLAERSSQGVRVQIVLDKASDQLEVLSKLWPSNERLDIYSTQGDAVLHAKLTVVDGRDMLVTSANLTGHGLRSNIEVGVRIQGPSAYSAYLLINKLINDGYFVRVEL